MNRKNLIGLVMVAATAAMCGCASAPASRHTAQVRQEGAPELANSRSALAKCIRAALPQLDDRQSPSATIARAALRGCATEDQDLVRALVRASAPSCGGGADCTRDVEAKAQRDVTQLATDEVVNARVHAAAAQVPKCQ